ncbi:hypothetical protein B5F08_11445 [Anaeromassilibacillus sp. An172]|uniref:hypothetical protein n=1 Tax=Anaeromassilibacillus sp. An172 TaxID=1965570 RepID=UPI000B375784|nr:hypothetical protein [Anaeromassilibacillus sp. An172]OUP75322.1 hypothetical protein B5F08_11445 [Anaeromassilibacillus sp. An172]
MSKKLVFVPLAYKSKYSMSANINTDNENGIIIYLKNALVLLVSIQRYNADVQTAVVTNFEIPENFKKIYRQNNILIFNTTFENYTMPSDFKWSLAFFKIKALEYVLNELNYDLYLELDSDEICISSISDMWLELDDKILMFASKFRYNHNTRCLYSDIYRQIYGETLNNNKKIIKTGGGFIAGNKKQLSLFINECDVIYSFLRSNIENIDKNIGDELYSSIYYAKYPEKVGDASPYIDVYWTGSFYYVSTNYKFDAVSLIHLPDEKQFGLLYLYDYYMKKGTFPNENIIFKLLSFPKYKKSFSFNRLLQKIIKKFDNKRY